MAYPDFEKIGVIMGGVSSEREISLKSGKSVVNALKSKGLKVVPIDLKTDEYREVKKIISLSGIDAVFIALHGYFGEDGKIQSILDDLGVPYTGSNSKASYLSMDKIASRRIFEANGLKVPAYKIIRTLKDLKDLNLNYPSVIKPSTNGSSIGLSIVDSKSSLKSAFELAKQFDENIIIEEYIAGRELTVGILGDEALPIIEIVPKKRFFDFEAKYQKGLTEYIVPAEIEESLAKKVQDVGLSAHKLLGSSGFSRADLILSNNEVFVLELNSIPGMTETSLLPKAAKAGGIGFEDLVLRIIKLALNKERMINAFKEK